MLVKADETAMYYEQVARVQDEAGPSVELRRITIELAKPTRKGDTVLHILTNVLPEKAEALMIAGLYRRRWTIGVVRKSVHLAG